MTAITASNDLSRQFSVEIRPVTAQDAVDLQPHCAGSSVPVQASREMLERTEKLSRTQRGLGVVAERGHIACGFGMLTTWPGTAEISDLIVTEPYRNHGIGSRIIGALTEAAREIGVVQLEIGAALSNPRAMALYQRLGFP